MIELTCNLGTAILEIFGPDHEFHELAKMILEYGPDEDYPFNVSEEFICNELPLSQNELDKSFRKYEAYLMSSFLREEPFTLSEMITLDIPFKGSAFFFELEDGKRFGIKTKREIVIDLGKAITPTFFGNLLGENFFKVKAKTVEMDFDRYYHVYILEAAR